MKFFLLAASLLFVHILSFGQDNFESGYIVRTSKDTLRGYVNRGTEEELSGQVSFKANDHADAQSFHPGEIGSYAIGEDIFRSVTFLNTSLDSPQTQTCFAKQLVQGKYDLYTFVKNERRFYILQSGQSVQLLFDSYYTNRGELVQEGNYNSRLRLILNACPSVSTKYQELEYGQKSMAGYIKDLDYCLEPATARDYYHKTKTTAGIFLTAGGLPDPSHPQFCAELGFRFGAPSINRKTFLNVSLRYTYGKDVTHSQDVNYTYIKYETTEKDYLVGVPLTIEYDFTATRIRPYAFGGLSLMYFINNVESKDPTAPPSDKGITFSPILGIGVDGYITSHFFVRVEMRYEYFLQYPNFQLGYKFN